MRANSQLRRLQTRVARLAASLAALALFGFYAAAPASAHVSFTRAWGWGVADAKSHFETCTTSCQGGSLGSGAGQLYEPQGVAVDGSGDVFVADYDNNRVDEFSPAGAFIKAWGWGVADGKSQFETCATICQAGIAGGGAGQLDVPRGVAVDGSGDVFVADTGNSRVDEFSSSGAVIKAWGWGVADGKGQFETCTTTCETGFYSAAGGAGELSAPYGVAVDGSGDVFVADTGYNRVDEFSSAGAFIKAWGWSLTQGQLEFGTCTTTCRSGLGGGGAGELDAPEGVAVDTAGDVFVADFSNERVDEFSSAGAFIRAWGFGVADDKDQFENCTTTCGNGFGGTGAGALTLPDGVAVDGSGDVFVTESDNNRVDEFSGAGAFIKAWGWGVLNGKSQFETCTTTCEGGVGGSGAGQLESPDGVAGDGSGDVFVTEGARVEEFGTAPNAQHAPSCALVPVGARVYVAARHGKHTKKNKKHPPFGVLKLRVRCNQTAAARLTGTIKAVKGTHIRAFTITAGRATVTAGRTLTMTVKLPNAAIAALEAGARGSVLFKLTATNANGTSSARAKVARLKLVKVG